MLVEKTSGSGHSNVDPLRLRYGEFWRECGCVDRERITLGQWLSSAARTGKEKKKVEKENR